MDYTITLKTMRTGGPEYEGDDFPHVQDITGPYVIECNPHLPGELSMTKLRLSNFDSFLTQLIGNLNLIKAEGREVSVIWDDKKYSFKPAAKKEESREIRLEKLLTEYFQPKNSS